jgi:hypothetical protein
MDTLKNKQVFVCAEEITDLVFDAPKTFSEMTPSMVAEIAENILNDFKAMHDIG